MAVYGGYVKYNNANFLSHKDAKTQRRGVQGRGTQYLTLRLCGFV